MIYYFLVTEGWAVTALVLLYVVWVYTLPNARQGLKLCVPLLISAAAHLLLLLSGTNTHIPRAVSDVFYSWFTPIAIYRSCAKLMSRCKRKDKLL